jgi:hypothetical protein
LRVTESVKASRDGFRWVHLTALALAVIMLPWSTAFLSIAQMLLAANWLAEGIARKDLGGRFKRAFSSAPVLVVLSFLALHMLGLLWTEDMAWGMDLVRILAPVLVFGVILGGSERLQAVELRTILLLGAWSAVASALVGQWVAPPDADYRTLSKFISHIRLALLLAFAAVVFIHYRTGPWWRLLAQGVGAVFAVYAIGRLGSLQALALLIGIAVVMLWRASASWAPPVRRGLRSAMVLLPVVALVWLAFLVKDRYRMPDADLDARAERTAGGELYDHDPTNPQTENGQHVWSYVVWGELARTWERRSSVPFDAKDRNGGPVYGTLARYLTSKGLRKDSVAVMGLTDEEVHAIEQGVASAHAGDQGRVRARLEEVMMEVERYRAYGDANGHSVTMRIEYLKAGMAIARDHWLVGVGTGDTRPAFAAQYERMHSSLLPEWRHRAHNEYLTLWISFGILGLAWSLFSWWWPAWKLGAWREPLFIAWAILFAGSCFTDDTVETQAGATFFALYYALFVFAAPRAGITGPSAR